MIHHRYLIACVLPLLFPVSILADKNTQQHLTEGNQFLSTGQFNDALISFDAAIRKYFFFFILLVRMRNREVQLYITKLFFII